MINLMEVSIQNFKSIENSKLSLYNQGLCSIIGNNMDDALAASNGAGKSTIIDAICWALYGKTVRGKTADSVLSWFNAKDCRVSVIIADGVSETGAYINPISIVRYRNHKEHGNNIYILYGTQLEDAATNKATQEKIEAILGFSYDIFCVLLIYGTSSKSTKPFMLKTDKEKKEFTDFLLDIEYLQTIQDAVKHDVSVKEDELSQISFNISNNESAKLEVEQSIEEVNQTKSDYLKQMEFTLKEKTTSLVKYGEEINKLVPSIKALEGKINAFVIPPMVAVNETEEERLIKGKITELTKQINSLLSSRANDKENPMFIKCIMQTESDIKLHIAKLKNYSDEFKNINDLNFIANAAEKIKELEYKISAETKAINNIESLGNACPTCHSKLTDDKKTKIIAKINEDIKSYKDTMESVQLEYDALVSGYKAWQEEQLEKHNAEVNKKIKELNNELIIYKKEYEDHKRSIEEEVITHKSKIKSEVEALENNISGLQNSLNDISKKRLADLETSRKNREAKIAERETLTTEYNSLLASYKYNKSIYDNIQIEINNIKTKPNNFDELIQKYIDRKNKIVDNITALNKQFNEVNNEVKHLSYWINGFGQSGIKSFILDSITSFLNQKANYALSKLSQNLKIKIETQDALKDGTIRDKYNVVVFNNGKKTEYEELSKGEATKVSISIDYANRSLAENYRNIRLNFTAFDEALDGLDYIGCENVVSFLKEYREEVSTIFVTSHNKDLNMLFDRNLVATKHNDRTTIKEI